MRSFSIFAVYICTVGLLFNATDSQSQSTVQWADSVNEAVKLPNEMSAQTKVDLLDRASTIYDSLNLHCEYIETRVRASGFISDLGDPEEALRILLKTEDEFADECEKETYTKILSNLSYVYLQLEELSRVDSICKKGLENWQDDWSFYKAKLSLLNNWAISSAYNGNMRAADSLFRQLLKFSRENQSLQYESRAYANLGTIKGMHGDVDSAYYFIDQAGRLALKENDLDNYLPILINLSQIELHRDNFPLAISILDSAERVAENSGNLDFVGMVQRAQSEVHEMAGSFELALNSLKEFISTREKFVNEERVRAVSEMQEKYESEKKAREIKALEVKNLDSQLENERIAKSRRLIFFGLILIVLVAGGLGNRLQFVRKSRKEIKKEKDRSEELLHNILPEEVATEIKDKGSSEAQLFDQVTVLFTDFKGFTSLSEQMSPKALVNDLNESFSEFDRITNRHGIEKIKTIGDAYMAVAGVPTPAADHAKRAVMAALEMAAFIEEGKKRKQEKREPFFEVRIGIHSGSVVAGIVGLKKFQYDIWGDTVNTASRMESSGDVGKVNISQSTYELLKDDPQFVFESRGKVEAKGKGEMDMYFVSLS